MGTGSSWGYPCCHCGHEVAFGFLEQGNLCAKCLLLYWDGKLVWDAATAKFSLAASAGATAEATDQSGISTTPPVKDGSVDDT